MYIGFNIKININISPMAFSAWVWCVILAQRIVADTCVYARIARATCSHGLVCLTRFHATHYLTPENFQGLDAWIRATLLKNEPTIVLDGIFVDDILCLLKKWWIYQIVGRFEELSQIYARVQQGQYIPDYPADTTFLWSWISYMKEITPDEEIQLYYTVCMEYLDARKYMYITKAEGYLNELSNGEVAMVAVAIYRNSGTNDAHIRDLLAQMSLGIDRNARPDENHTKAPGEME